MDLENWGGQAKETKSKRKNIKVVNTHTHTQTHTHKQEAVIIHWGEGNNNKMEVRDIKELRMRAQYRRQNKQCNHNVLEMRTEKDNEQDCILEIDFFPQASV